MKLSEREKDIVRIVRRLVIVNESNKRRYGFDFIPDFELHCNVFGFGIDEMIEMRKIIHEEGG
jgi:hypothetical protein